MTDKSSGCPLDFTEQLIAFDDFDDGVDGWSKSTLSEPICGSDPMLVLVANEGAIASKTYSALPAHTHVRVQATAYFVDDWQGESAAIHASRRVRTWPWMMSASRCSPMRPDARWVGAWASWSLEPVQKTYAIPGKHTQLRIQATVYFLDRWQGETATITADGAAVWVDSWHHCPSG